MITHAIKSFEIAPTVLRRDCAVKRGVLRRDSIQIRNVGNFNLARPANLVADPVADRLLQICPDGLFPPGLETIESAKHRTKGFLYKIVGVHPRPRPTR